MALTFPLALDVFFETLPFRTVSLDLNHFDETSGLANGQILSAKLADPLWGGSVQFGSLTYRQYATLRARMSMTEGAKNVFYVTPRPFAFPANDPTGSILTGSTVTINSIGSDNKSLSLAGLPTGFTLTLGDLFSFDFGSPAHRTMHMVQEVAVANGSGVTPEFAVQPPIYPGTTTGITVTLKKPSIKAFVVPGTIAKGTQGDLEVTGVGFDIMQRLR